MNTLRQLGAEINLRDETLRLQDEVIPTFSPHDASNPHVASMQVEVDLELPVEPKPGDEVHEDEVFPHQDVTETQTKQFNDMIRKWKQSFATSPGRTDRGNLKLYVDEDLPPVKQRYIRLSPTQQQQANEEVDRLLAENVIEPSDSPWSSPAFIIKRKDGRPRLVVDYRKLNERCRKNAAPLPAMNETLDMLRASKFVSSIDLANAYNLFPMHADSVEKTAFAIQNRGLFQFKMCPFGLATAPNAFQQLIESILRPALYKYAICYLDDVLIFSSSFEEHISHVNEVLKLLRDAQLRISWKKSQFCRERLLYLGFIVGQGELQVNQQKVEAIKMLALPRTPKQLRSFIALIGWFRRFVHDLSTKIEPLQEMNKTGMKLEWTPERVECFNSLRRELCEAPTLSMPDFSIPFEVHCDASAVGISGVLLQRIEGQVKVIAYTSRTLSPRERNYSVTERECLAVLTSLEHWRAYIQGQKVEVFTDHASLLWLTSLKDPQGRLARWVLRLAQFDVVMKFVKGTDNILPDLLSRNPYEQEQESPDDGKGIAVQVFSMDVSKTTDQWYKSLLEKVKQHPSRYPSFVITPEGALAKRIRDPVTKREEFKVVLPVDYRQKVLQECHDAPGAGHFGVRKTVSRVAQGFYFPKLREEVRDYVQKCIICQRHKPTNTAPAGLMKVHQYPMRPMRALAIDFVGPLPSSNGFKYILVAVCMATKWVILQPTRDCTTKTVIRFFDERVLPAHAAPEIVLSDNGSAFISSEMKRYFSTHFIQQHLLPTHYPCANPSERVNRVVKTAISIYTKGHKRWSETLPMLEYALRTAVSETTGFSPAKLLYGEELRPMFDPNPKSWNSSAAPFVADKHVQQMTEDRKKIYAAAQEAVKKAKDAQKKTYDLRRRAIKFQVGDLVWCKNFPRSSAIKGEAAKLFAKYQGPFRISKVHSDTQYQLADLKSHDAGRHHVSHLKKAFID